MLGPYSEVENMMNGEVSVKAFMSLALTASAASLENSIFC